MASRLRLLEAMLEQYDADAGAETLAGMVVVDETGAVPAQVAVTRRRKSVAFLRLRAPASRSAAIMYEAALHRDIGLRELALGREDSAVRHYAAGASGSMRKCLSGVPPVVKDFGDLLTATALAMVTMQIFSRSAGICFCASPTQMSCKRRSSC